MSLGVTICVGKRLVSRPGCYDMIWTTVKAQDRLPKHLLADEKHVKMNGEKAYWADHGGT